MKRTEDDYVICEGDRKGEKVQFSHMEYAFKYNGRDSVKYTNAGRLLLKNEEGYGTVNGLSICPGDCLLISKEYDEIVIEGEMQLEIYTVEVV